MGVEARVEDSHLDCGNGIEWILKLRQSGLERILVSGSLEDEHHAIRPGQRFRLRRGDEFSLLVGSLKHNARCDLTRVDLTVRESAEAARVWDLADNVIDSVLEGNPHGDAFGNPGVWRFFHPGRVPERSLACHCPGFGSIPLAGQPLELHAGSWVGGGRPAGGGHCWTRDRRLTETIRTPFCIPGSPPWTDPF